MGLFSFFNKNKQETTADDSGYYSRSEDDAVAARARSKRASSAGEPAARRGNASRDADPVLPEKKRARRRLVGAIALALAVAVGLPMLFDAEPKRLASDIAIQIPSKDKAPPLPAPSVAPAEASIDAAAVAAADTLDHREEFVEPGKVSAAAEARIAAPPAAEPRPARPEPKARSEPEPRSVAKAEPKRAETKAAETKPAPAAKPAEKAAPKLPEPAVTRPVSEEGRALAILEGKAGEKAPADAAAQKYVLQVAALATQEKVNELQSRLKEAGISSFTQKATNGSGERVIRIRVGPFGKDDAEKMRARLDKLGLSGSMVPV